MSSTELPPGVDILHLDDYLCAVRKPAGMPVQPDRTGDPDLLQVLAAKLNGAPPGLVHRLDRPVSGVVLLARDPDVLRKLNAQFAERVVEKHYWAIVEAVPAAVNALDWTELEHVLLHDGRSHRARVRPAQLGEAGVSRLHFKVMAQGKRLTLMVVRPEGGAFHQIRAQLAAAGMPIRGDVKYGARRGERDRSIALHARSLSFMHPVTGLSMLLEADPPRTGTWNTLLSMAGHGPVAS